MRRTSADLRWRAFGPWEARRRLWGKRRATAAGGQSPQAQVMGFPAWDNETRIQGFAVAGFCRPVDDRERRMCPSGWANSPLHGGCGLRTFTQRTWSLEFGLALITIETGLPRGGGPLARQLQEWGMSRPRWIARRKKDKASREASFARPSFPTPHRETGRRTGGRFRIFLGIHPPPSASDSSDPCRRYRVQP